MFQQLGGEPGVRALVERFYDVMDEDEMAADVRAMHPADLTLVREKLFMFLCGWSGGPPLYVERYGHPRLRARHLPFAIDTAARDQWMHCMLRAMQALEIEEPTFTRLARALHDVADFMRNRPD